MAKPSSIVAAFDHLYLKENAVFLLQYQAPSLDEAAIAAMAKDGERQAATVLKKLGPTIAENNWAAVVPTSHCLRFAPGPGGVGSSPRSVQYTFLIDVSAERQGEAGVHTGCLCGEEIFSRKRQSNS